MDNHICPECLAGKHDNCVTEALCVLHDEIVTCACSFGQHEADHVRVAHWRLLSPDEQEVDHGSAVEVADVLYLDRTSVKIPRGHKVVFDFDPVVIST